MKLNPEFAKYQDAAGYWCVDSGEFRGRRSELTAANHLSLELAREYMSLIGDTPESDANGKIVVRDENGVALARLTRPE